MHTSLQTSKARSIMRGGALPVFRGTAYQSGNGNPYYQFYRSQMGHGLPVFQGTSYQYGAGLGDVLRGLFRTVFPFLAPIATRAATGFISNTAQRLESGSTLKDAARGALGPTLEGVADTTAEQIARRIQRGSGRSAKRRVTHARKLGRRGAGQKRVYKGVKRYRKPTKTRQSKRRKLPFKSNF